MDLGIFVLRLLAALALGLLLGFDREVKHAPVGVRTFALVAVGAALYTMLTLELGGLSDNAKGVVIDPSRLIQGLIGGIGFLGAGAIIGGSGNKVRGMATGAAIWVAGGIGVACGLGLYLQAAGVTLICVVLLFGTEWAQVKWGQRDHLVRHDESEMQSDRSTER